MTLPPDSDLQADLYVLGLLEADDQAAVERRIEQEPDFAARVFMSAERFAPLDGVTPFMSLPAGAWDRLEARLAARGGQTAAPTTADIKPKAANLVRAPLRAALAFAAALLLAFGLAWAVLPRQAADPSAVAVLLDPEGAPFALVEDFGDGEAVVTTLAAFDVPEDGSLQVWTKWSEDVGPVSLGILEEFEGASVGADGLPPPRAGQLYEITLEAEGGSATGRPTGPILGVGRASIPR